MNRFALAGLAASGIVGVVACTSQVPLGSGTAQTQEALGGPGEPPHTDGTCDARLSVCANVCVDPTGDPRNCGGCAIVCGGTEPCSAGECVAPTSSDDAGSAGDGGSSADVPCGVRLITCGTACIDPLADPQNCGGCGMACAAGDTCSGGECASAVSSSDDAGAPDSGAGDDAAAPPDDAGTRQLSVVFDGYDSYLPWTGVYYLSVYLIDTTSGVEADCGGGSFTGTDGAPNLIPGHSYTYNYWIDTSSLSDCFGYAIPPYRTVAFGPVTGDTAITASPSDPETTM